MHALFETEQVLDHIRSTDKADGAIVDDRSAVRIGMALLCLGGNPATSSLSLAAAYKRLQRANDDGLLQVFLDQDGVRRGYAILAMLDDEADSLARTDPIKTFNELRSHAGGSNAWLVAVSGGLGQGRSIARHLRDNFLKEHDRLTYLRRLNGRLMLKTLVCESGRGFGRREGPAKPEPHLSFAQFCLRRDRIEAFYHYARLVSAASPIPVDIKSAIDSFTHPISLLQYRFGEGASPASFFSWAMLDEKIMQRLEAEKTGHLRPGDWSCGPIPCVIEGFGDPQELENALKSWASPNSSAPHLRLRIDPHANEVSFANAR